ncbi:type IV toxin-antitoxin system AbiEi family antitoxin domain-containing protein [Cellulomonas sp. NPDC058312]|uniref:type IV toxin-antitoxin system AbiEi family antitoxin domain-containing protein n=1 Tax=Cellulomonas sp. NPDC058312 TaxID=3346441 RepID=UPI0036E48847
MDDALLRDLLAGGCFTARDALARGATSDQLRAAVRAGAVQRVRRGVYGPGARGASGRGRAEADAEVHRVRVAAAALALRDPVFSHRSAAAVWGLPLLGPWPTHVEVTSRTAGGGRSRTGVRRHACADPVPRVEVEGVLVTDLARTVVDLARSEGLASALVAADHAVREHPVGRAELERELRSAGSGRGVRSARLVVALTDGRSESPGESLSRARMYQLGIQPPELQHRLADSRGPIGRVDFWWPAAGVVGEFDGRTKYRAGAVGDPLPPEERVWREKRREDRIRALGLRVARWTWADAWAGAPLRTTLCAAGVGPATQAPPPP